MPRLYFILSNLLVAAVLSGCAGQPANARSLESNETATEISTRPVATESVQAEGVAPTPPKDCPITVPQDPPFLPPAPYDQLGFEGEFWYGSNALWTAVRYNGTWEALPHNPEGYTQKVFWWRDGYIWTEEPEPALTVTAERLDAKAPTVQGSKATNAYAADIGSAMLVGVDLPTLGCWKITGRYKDTELSFVVRVAP